MVATTAASPEKRWLRFQEASLFSGLSTSTLRALVKAGKLTAHRPVRGCVRLCRDELDAYMAASTGDIEGPRRGKP